ncbi:GNAT family N-acetyltransferase [Actinomycetospora atypica]|uniref:GNAT family N-acetyltransferase n=1 Tax=Actinomycetospora atypica TaxID=1290095 RepID=A0ABV9YWE5_9PSEU
MRIVVDDLSGPEIARFLTEHLAHMREVSPPGSVHALDLDALRRPDVTFWSVYDADELVGCAALKRHDATHGEIKSMRTHPGRRRSGVGALLLEHVLAAAKAMNLTRLSLETGATDHFAPARALYARYGFEPCGPFADYTDDPHSVYLTRTL